MRQFVLVLLTTLVAAGSQAQVLEPQRFLPSTPGNRWVYASGRVDTFGSSTETSQGRVVVESLRDTTYGDTPFTVYSITRLDADGDTLRVEEAVRSFTDDWGSKPGWFGRGDLLPDTSPAIVLTDVSPGGSVEVGGVTYPVDGTAESGYVENCGSGQMTCTYARRYGTDIGPYYAEYSRVRAQPQLVSEVLTFTLVYAEVDGAEYGDLSFATFAEPAAPAVGASVVAFPNPSRGTLGLRLSGLWLDRVDLEVYDVLGRLVWRGGQSASAPFSVDLRGVGPGSYTVRVRDRSGTMASARIVQL